MDSPRPSPISKPVRLQKHLAACGVGSRRACEMLIEQGLVSVDGEIVRRQGMTVDPRSQRICVRNRPIAEERKVYLVLNKPRDILCTSRDPQRRKTIHALLPDGLGRVYTVGRLDRDSEGLLLITNDGRLAQALSHPRHHVKKTYRVWARGALRPDQLARMTSGVRSDGEILRAEDIEVLHTGPRISRYKVVLGQGRKRQIRRMFNSFDIGVARLQRIAVGPLTMGPLQPGHFRYLNAGEVEKLYASAKVKRNPAPA